MRGKLFVIAFIFCIAICSADILSWITGDSSKDSTASKKSVEADVEECDVAPISVLVFQNGGNNSGEPFYEFQVSRSKEGFQAFLQEAKQKVYPNFANSTLFNRWGQIVNRPSKLLPNESYFLVPQGHRWFWPGMYVGYKVELKGLPYPNKSHTLWMETLSLSPRLFRIENFLTDDEADWIIATAAPKMAKSQVVEDDGGKLHNSRTSSSTWLWKNEGDVVRNIDNRVGVVSHISPKEKLEEAMQVVHYLPGQFYQSHLDWFDPKVHKSNPEVQAGVNRMITVFYYLNTVTEGGETIFPHAGPTGYKLGGSEWVDMADCSRGIGVQPKKGSAVLWYSLTAAGHMQGEGDYASLHGACAPRSGEKYGANKWLYNFNKERGRSYDGWSENDLV